MSDFASAQSGGDHARRQAYLANRPMRAGIGKAAGVFLPWRYRTVCVGWRPCRFGGIGDRREAVRVKFRATGAAAFVTFQAEALGRENVHAIPAALVARRVFLESYGVAHLTPRLHQGFGSQAACGRSVGVRGQCCAN